MTERFDIVKAATDLKQLLKMNDGMIPQDEATQSMMEVSINNTNVKYSEEFGTSEICDAAKISEQPGSVSISSHTHTNSNGNALLVPLVASHQISSESKLQDQRDSASCVDHQPVLTLQEQGISDHKLHDIKKTSSEKINSETLRSDVLKETDNTKRSSQVKSEKKLTDTINNQKSKDSSINVNEAGNPVDSRNQKKNEDALRKGAEGDKNARKGQYSRDGSRNGNSNTQRTDGGILGNKGGENQSSKTNNKPQLVKLGGQGGRTYGYYWRLVKQAIYKRKYMELSSDYLMLLEENKIHLLKKKSQKFPKAKFYCHLCDYHLHVKDDCDKHIKDIRHCRRKEINKVDAVLRSLPRPSEQQLAALTAAVEELYEKHGINELEQKQRADIVSRLEKALKDKIPDVVLYLYGSSLTGFGLKTSDINVDLTSADRDKKLTTLLKEVHYNLKDRTDSGFSKVIADFTAKVPGLLLTDDSTGLVVNAAIHCYSAHCSSELLSIYSDFDIRVRKLAVAFRYWAHLCGLDRQSDGYIPPQALNLMVIFFLQNVNPQVVPIIQPPKVTGDECGDYRNDAAKFEKMRTKVTGVIMSKRNTMSVGELWLKLLKFYSLEFDTPNVVVSIRGNQTVSRHSKPWNSKKLAVEDPYMQKKNITRMANSSHVFEYWQDSIRKALRYFGFPPNSEGGSNITAHAFKKVPHDSNATSQSEGAKRKDKKITENVHIELSDSNIIKKSSLIKGDTAVKVNSSAPVVIAPNPLLSCRISPPSKGVHKLLKLKDCPETEAVIANSIPLSTSLERRDSDLDTTDSSHMAQQSSSEDTDVLNSQLKSITTDDSNEEKSLVLSNMNIPVDSPSQQRIDSQSLSSDLMSNQSSGDISSVNSGICVGLPQFVNNKELSQKTDNIGSIALKGASSLVNDAIDHMKVERSDSDNIGNADISSKATDINAQSVLKLTDQNVKSSSSLSSSETSAERQKDVFSMLTQSNYCYKFSEEYLTDGKGPVLVCEYCDKEGHLKNTCPEDELPEILPLPPVTPFHVKVLSETLSKLPAEVGLSEEGLAEREKFMKALEEFIRVQLNDANLALFGSSCNGFGFDKSDMDICLTFTQRKVNDKSRLIESLANKMKQHVELTNVEAIPTAKVPIVKFTVKKTGLEGDISLYNILAQQNTKLLLCYSKIDPRVSILGYTIKTFAKVCDIGDASRGSLSSYAYILMMLYYLQQVEPPVIPVLQELYKGKEKPEIMIEGCDAWFMDDLSQLDELWPEKGQNKMSVAELWLGFLCFYVEEFKHKEFVVSIRQKSLLTRFEKLWNGSCIAIEDPFDLSHNLGSGLTKKMNNFIFKTFINGRMLYGSPVDENMEIFNKYQSPSDYFFDTDLLSECRPPNVRGCRRCGKIGHLSRHCPAALKEKEEEQKRVQQQLQQQQLQLQQQQLQQHLQMQQQQQLQMRQQQKQPYSQEKRRPPQQQLLQLRQPQPHQRPPLSQRLLPQQQQQSQGQKQQVPQNNDRRKQDRWQNDTAANINRNASAPAGSGQTFNFGNHPNLKPTTPAILRGLQPQVYSNTNFPLYNQQHPHRGLMPSGPVHPPPGFMPQPTMLPAAAPRHNMNAFNYAAPNVRGNMFYNLGYQQIPPSFSGWHPQNNNHQRGQQTQHPAHFSGYVNDGNNANLQGMNPQVQSLFASAKGQVLGANSNQPHRQK